MIETSSLRRKLLDLAITGKLVPRTGEWKTVKLGDIAEIQLGKMLDRVKNSGKSFKYLANFNVRWGAFDLAGLKETLFTADEVEKFALRAGDLLMCEGGVPGRCAIWRENNSAIKYQKAIHRIRVHEGVLPEYLQILFEAIHDKPDFSRKFTGSTIHHLPREVLVNLEVPLPPLAEQKAIVKRLEELLALESEIAADSSVLDDLISAAKSKILQLAVSGKLIISGKVTSLKSPHDGWKMLKLCDIGKWGSGATPPRSNRKYYDGGTIPWLKTGDLNDGHITDIPEHISKLALTETSVRMNPVGSVLIAMYGATIGKLGILDVAATTNQACCACQPNELILREYLFYYLLSQREVFRKLGGGGAQPNISKQIILEYSIPLPPLAEQKAIVAKVDELFSVLDAMKGSQK